MPTESLQILSEAGAINVSHKDTEKGLNGKFAGRMIERMHLDKPNLIVGVCSG